MKIVDFDFVYTLIRENLESYFEKYWGGWNDKIFREGLATGIIKIVEVNGQKIGLIHYGFVSDHVYIYNIQLDKLHRNKGIGTQLLRTIEEEVRKKKYYKIQLKVFKSNPAISLYKRLEYTKIIEDDANSVLLEKKL
jgi:ribosomal protein S18 acetylase RimI-like enzyme